MRRKGVRRVVVAVALAAVMVVGRAAPAGAFLSSLDPAGWAVVAQMAAIISQAIAIKRQVENVRNQARAEFFGKLAPLTGKLTVVAGWVRNARSRAGVLVYNPASHAVFLPPDTLPEFNRPMPECVVGAPAAADPCMPPITAARLPASLVTDLGTSLRGAALSSGSTSPFVRSYSAADGRMTAAILHLQQRTEALAARQAAMAATEQRRRQVARALVEEQMAIVEDWRGCQEAPAAPGTRRSVSRDRLPCMTTRGLASRLRCGTQGAQSDLAAKIDALGVYQDGDVSKVQLDTMQTQLLVTLGRLQAARVEREAVALEQEQEALVAREALRRREVELVAADFDCKQQFGIHSYFIENMPPTVPPGGRCLQVNDVSAAAVAAASSGCLLAGSC